MNWLTSQLELTPQPWYENVSVCSCYTEAVGPSEVVARCPRLYMGEERSLITETPCIASCCVIDLTQTGLPPLYPEPSSTPLTLSIQINWHSNAVTHSSLEYKKIQGGPLDRNWRGREELHPPSWGRGRGGWGWETAGRGSRLTEKFPRKEGVKYLRRSVSTCIKGGCVQRD